MVAETCINGSCNDPDVAECFRDHFFKIYDSATNTDLDSFDQFYNEYVIQNKVDVDTASNFVIDIETVERAVQLLKTKAGFVPNKFGKGVVVPIIKNKLGNHSSVDNYRPITLSPVLTKVFKHCLMCLLSGYISSDNLQFGFEAGFSCSHALFTLRTVCDY